MSTYTLQATVAKLMPCKQNHKYAYKSIQTTSGQHELQEEEGANDNDHQKRTFCKEEGADNNSHPKRQAQEFTVQKDPYIS